MSTQPSIHPKEEHKEANGLDDKDNDIKAETEDQKKKAVKPKKRRKRRRASSSEAARDEFDMWQTVQQRYGTKKVHNEIKEAMFDPTTGKIFHPSSYERMMARSVEAHLNRMLQPESPEDLVDSKWLCAFCFKPTCANDQGELYGPYFIRLSTDCQPPDELLLTKSVTLESTSTTRCRSNFAQEEAVNSKKFGSSPKHPSPTTMVEGSLDIWLHGDCALWAPELFLVGGRLPTLQFHIHRYWEQKCFVCSGIGATIPITYPQTNPMVTSNKASNRSKTGSGEIVAKQHFLHYKCAVDNGYRLNSLIYVCHPP